MKIFITHPGVNRVKLNDEQPVNIEAISEIASASCISVHLNNVLDYILPKDRDKALYIAISKLRIDGTISINGVDFFAMGTFVANGLVTISEVNHGVMNGRLSLDSINLLEQKLINNKLEIVRTSIDGFSYSIVARRNP